MRAHQGAVLQVVAADRRGGAGAAPGAPAGAVCTRRDPRQRAVRRLLDLGGQRGDARGQQPAPRPSRPGRARSRADSSASRSPKHGVAPGVGAEVRAQPLEELLAPDPGHELLEHARALGVRDAVEVDLDVLQVADVGDDGVGGRQLVLPVGPRLLHRGERRPRLVPAGRLGRGQRRGELGEGLVEPQVVPPAHGHEVAEPHVGELVQHRDRAALVERLGGLGAEDVGLGEGHAAGVLHRPALNSGTKSWSYFSNGYALVERLLVEGEARGGWCRGSPRRPGARRGWPGRTRRAGTVRPSRLVSSLRTTWYGPATSAVT